MLNFFKRKMRPARVADAGTTEASAGGTDTDTTPITVLTSGMTFGGSECASDHGAHSSGGGDTGHASGCDGGGGHV